jgi:redox-sensitive bicupin YhaK (pirin superfamily)
MVRGELDVCGKHLQAGDALLMSEESSLTFQKGLNAEVLVFDLTT